MHTLIANSYYVIIIKRVPKFLTVIPLLRMRAPRPPARIYASCMSPTSRVKIFAGKSEGIGRETYPGP